MNVIKRRRKQIARKYAHAFRCSRFWRDTWQKAFVPVSEYTCTPYDGNGEIGSVLIFSHSSWYKDLK